MKILKSYEIYNWWLNHFPFKEQHDNEYDEWCAEFKYKDGKLQTPSNKE